MRPVRAAAQRMERAMKRCLTCGCVFSSDGWKCPACDEAPPAAGGFLAFAPALDHQAPGFREDYFAQLAALEVGNFWFEARNRLIVWAFGREFPNAKSFLEVGCGTGFVLSGIADAFPRLRLCGSEIYTTGLSYARQRAGRAELIQADAEHIPFAGEFDVIGAFDVLEHIEDDAKVLNEMHRALAPGGGIVLTVPQHRFLWSRQDEYDCHVRRYEWADLAQKIGAAGFSVVRSTSFVTLLMPLLILSRRWRKQARLDPMQEFRIGRTSNALLATIMNLERALIRSGLSMQFGGSRLVIARKRGK